jgi:hypothetical protein
MVVDETEDHQVDLEGEIEVDSNEEIEKDNKKTRI